MRSGLSRQILSAVSGTRHRCIMRSAFERALTKYLGFAPNAAAQAVEDLHAHVFALGLRDGVGCSLFRVGKDVRDAVDIAIHKRLVREQAAWAAADFLAKARQPFSISLATVAKAAWWSPDSYDFRASATASRMLGASLP